MINNIPIHVRSTFSEKLGTKIVSENEIDYKKAVTGVAYSKSNAKISVVGDADFVSNYCLGQRTFEANGL